MLELFQMWALVEILGIVCLPLTIAVFHNLPDRGWAFSKALGLAILAFCVWLPLVCIHSLPFSQLFIAGVALILLACSLLSFMRTRQALVKLIRHNLSYIVVTEVVFLGMVFLLGWLRSLGPEIRSFEMFMDEGFIASIMRSPNFPPNDMWFSGYSINYYYYAHYTVAVLAKLLGQSPSVAFNTGISMFFGLTAVNLFGVTCNVVSWTRYLRTQRRADAIVEPADLVLPPLLPAVPFGLFTMLIGLILGNLAATQQWWQNHGNGAHYDWFGPSRVITGTINEFPAFSFLLSCFHAHVLALAFTILAIGMTFNLFLEANGRGLFAFGRGWRLPLTLAATALVIGGLFLMNGWDYPTYMGLTLICIALQQWLAYQSRFQFGLLLDIFSAAASLVALSFIFYIPFYLRFSSPSQGLGFISPNLRASLGEEIMIYGLSIFVFLSLLLASVLKHPLFEKRLGEEALEEETVLSGVALAYVGGGEHLGLGLSEEEQVYRDSDPVVSEDHVASHQDEEEQPVEALPVPADTLPTPPGPLNFLLDFSLVRLVLICLYLLASIAVLRFVPNSGTLVVGCCLAVLGLVMLFYNIGDRSHAFALLLGATACALIAGCEVFYLKDAFSGGDYQRMNSVFKFYFQAWALFSIASGIGLFLVIESFRPLITFSLPIRMTKSFALSLWSLVLLLLVLASLAYPLAAPYARFARFDPATQKIGLVSTSNLDGLTYLKDDPAGSADYAAIRWLNNNVQGDPVIVESMGDDYTGYGRISAFTGLPTLMGWAGHEVQWRLNWLNVPANSAEFNRRGGDINLIYTSNDSNEVLTTMAHYHAQYLYVGPLEQTKFPQADLHRYSTFMQIVYNANGVAIYKVK